MWLLWMGTPESPVPIRKGSGGICFGVVGPRSKRDLVSGCCLQVHGDWDVQIPLERGGRGEDSEAGCEVGEQ